MKSIPARHTNIMGQKAFGIESIRTYIIDFQHKIERYERCCLKKYSKYIFIHLRCVESLRIKIIM